MLDGRIVSCSAIPEVSRHKVGQRESASCMVSLQREGRLAAAASDCSSHHLHAGIKIWILNSDTFDQRISTGKRHARCMFDNSPWHAVLETNMRGLRARFMHFTRSGYHLSYNQSEVPRFEKTPSVLIVCPTCRTNRSRSDKEWRHHSIHFARSNESIQRLKVFLGNGHLFIFVVSSQQVNTQ